MLNHLSNTLRRWLFPPYHSQQQALQWWHQRQRDRLHHNAELIREKILQDLFSLRRELELAQWEGKPVESEQLQRLENLHHDLKQLGHDLSSSFSQDSLALAIQDVVDRWRSPNTVLENRSLQRRVEFRLHPAPTLVEEQPWHHDLSPPDRLVQALHPLVVTVLEEWLLLVTDQMSAAAGIKVQLHSGNLEGQLTLQLHEPDSGRRRAIAHTPELAYLSQVFELLTAGTAIPYHTHHQLEWRFCWLITTEHGVHRHQLLDKAMLQHYEA